MEPINVLLGKCKNICDSYESRIPGAPRGELFLQFCDDTMRMGFLVAASDGYVDAREIDMISYTFGVKMDYFILTKSYGLDYMSEDSFLKKLPLSVKAVAEMEKRDNPMVGNILENTRVLYETMKVFGDLMLNCIGARLTFCVMLQNYYNNNLLNYIFRMEEMDGFAISQASEVMSYNQILTNLRRGSAPPPEPEPEQEHERRDGTLKLKMPVKKPDPDNLNPAGVNPMGMNSAGANPMGMNQVGQTPMGMNQPGYNHMGSGQKVPDTYGPNSIQASQVNGVNQTQEGASRAETEQHITSIRGEMSLATDRSSRGSTTSISAPIDMDTINSILAEVDSLTGLGNVKKEIHDMVNMMLINEMRRRKGLKSPVVSRHLVFTGNPGTGKTTIARIIGKIYKTLGILEKGHMIETDRTGMVAGYMGQTAEKVTEIVKQAMGGILFIDEAYSLVSENEGDYGQEAINTLLKLMEDNRDNLVVIVAG